jgi:hypothetical protein
VDYTITNVDVDFLQVRKNLLKFKYTGFKMSKVNPRHTNTFLQDEPEFQDFCKKILKKFPADYKIVNMWGTFQAAGEYTGIHNHTSGGVGNNNVTPEYSFCYYLHDIKESGALLFHNKQNPTFCITEFPKKGHLYIFKSDVLHSTQPNLEGFMRYCIAGNVGRT